MRRLFDEWDRVFSRFRPTSELNLVSSASQAVVLVSPLFAQVVRVALDAARRTGGLVDPTLGAAIEAAGYDRDFAALPPDGTLDAAERGHPESVALVRRVLSRPAGLQLDLNGVVRSLAVDHALALLAGDGFVSAGGRRRRGGRADGRAGAPRDRLILRRSSAPS